jgi:3-oxoacyl-[acyl-carrier protein] reductase
MDLGLAEHVVFVTGASGGIGRALAQAFAAEGARVVLAGRARARELQDWVAQQDWRERALVVRADVREPASLATAFSSAVDAFGRVDACIANAGAWPAPDVPLHEADERRIRETLDVNLLGALWTARAFLAALARTGPRADGHGASLVFVGSTAGRFGEAGHAEYATAKAGLVGLMRSLKNEIVRLDPFGRVNLVEPGWTVTHMVRPALGQPGTIAKVLATMPVRQLGRAADVAAAIAWLCSPLAARHVSGQTLTLAGGMEGRQLWTDDEIDEAAVRLRARE